MFTTYLSIVTGFIGLLFLFLMAVRPQKFWGLLIFAAFGTAGLMLKGHCLVDEILTCCLLLGLFLALSVGGLKKRKTVRFGFHELAFISLMVFMIAQSLRGTISLGEPIVLFWVFFYFSLLAIVMLSSRFELSNLNPLKAAKIMVLSSLLYLIAYMTYTAYNLLVRGIVYHLMQGEEWSGSAYAVFPPAMALPAAALLLREGRNSFKTSTLAWLYMSMLAFTAFFHDSRVLYGVMLGFLVFSWKVISFKRIVAISFLFVAGVFFVYNEALVRGSSASFGERLANFTESLEQTADVLWNPREEDVGRQAHIIGGFHAITENLATFLFGYGVHQHRYVIGPYIAAYVETHTGFDHGYDSASITRTNGLPAILVDTGIIGLFLHAAIFGLAALAIANSRDVTGRWLFIYIVGCAFLWLAVANIQDILLFYLIAMPNGVFALICQPQMPALYRTDVASRQ